MNSERRPSAKENEPDSVPTLLLTTRLKEKLHTWHAVGMPEEDMYNSRRSPEARRVADFVRDRSPPKRSGSPNGFDDETLPPLVHPDGISPISHKYNMQAKTVKSRYNDLDLRRSALSFDELERQKKAAIVQARLEKMRHQEAMERAREAEEREKGGVLRTKK